MVAAIRAPSVNVCFDTVRLLVPDSITAPESPQALLAVHGAFMSEIVDCDPAKGFVAFPVALFDLDLSPGAFRTLAELCRMANTSGQCWPSLAQLGRRLGRSRAAVSGYIAELRAAGVLATEEQKMANGYNYRLRYTVLFWKEWRAGLGQERKTRSPKPPVQKPERRVQPVERPLETKNHIHSKQTNVSVSHELVSDWKAAVGNAPYPAFAERPGDALLKKTELLAAEPVISEALISADIEVAFAAFTERHGIDPLSLETIAGLAPLLTSPAQLDTLIAALEAQWQAHWQKPPNLFQLKRCLSSLTTEPDPASTQKLLKSYLRRWDLYRRSLPSSALRSKVAA